MPVRLASFELFNDTFGNIDGVVPKDEIQFALSVLIEHILDRLGDSNLRLHESARRCVLLVAERPDLLGLGGTLAVLRRRLEEKTGAKAKAGDRPKVHFGVLDAVGVLLQHFPGRRSGGGSRSKMHRTAEERSPGDDDDDDDEADAG